LIVDAPGSGAPGNPDNGDDLNSPGKGLIARARHGADVPLTDWMALSVCIAPILVAMARALAPSWRPVYDSAYFTARSLDVLGKHHPFVGAWSTFAAALGEQLNNLGSIQVLVLAPFTKIHPYAGTAIGTGLINLLAVVAVWRVARLLFGARGVATVMAATAIVQMSFGAPALVDARQQHALILPVWALLWLTAALLRGHVGAAMPWVFAASYVLQTHFSSSYLAAFLVVAGTSGLAVTVWRRRDRSALRHAAGALGVAILLWVHPLWDQFFLTGNLGRVLRHASGEHPAGINTSVRILADSPLGYPFWWPGSIKGFGAPWTFGTVVAWVIVVSWLATLGLAAAVARRAQDRRNLTLAGLAAASLVTSAVAAAQIPPSGFRSLPQTYFWLWPVAAFVVVAIGASLGPLLPRVDHLTELLVGLGTVAALLALPNRYTFPPWQIDELETAAGRPLLEQIGPSLAVLDFDTGPAIVVENPSFRLLTPDYYNIIAELTRSGLDVHFPIGSDDLQRYGTERCETGDERWRLRIVVGAQRPELSNLDVVLATTDGPPASVDSEFDELNAEILGLVTQGSIHIDRSALADAGFAGTGMLRVLDSPEDRHRDLWFYLFPLLESGVAVAPPQHRGTIDRWTTLARASIAGHTLVYMTPNYFPPADTCP
jgi:hypothetical protein